MLSYGTDDHQLRGRGYNQICVLYPRICVDEITLCRFVMNDGLLHAKQQVLFRIYIRYNPLLISFHTPKI